MMGADEMGIEVTETVVFRPATALATPTHAPVESLPHPAGDELELAAVLHALSDPMRLRIVVALASGDDRPCGSFDLPVTKSTCTHHFKVLREAGVIRQRLEGTTRLNSLRREDLERRFPGLLDSVLRAAARRVVS
jgi:DNA-binding transcriptional ArsR family regulator